MEKLWVRNLATKSLNKVGSLKFGAEDFGAAYKEMKSRGYKFEIGVPMGDYTQYWGLYLTNPLDIKVEPSKFECVNKLNERVILLQEKNAAEIQKTLNRSLTELFKELDGAYARARSASGPAMMFAPEDAMNKVIEDQKIAYKNFIMKLKTSSPEERKNILKKVIGSKNMTDNAKLAVAFEAVGIFTTDFKKVVISPELLNLLRELEGTYERAKNASGAAIMFASDDAMNRVVRNQEVAYDQFVSALKVCTPEEKRSVMKRVLSSRKLTDNAKVSIISELMDSLIELTPSEKPMQPQLKQD